MSRTTRTLMLLGILLIVIVGAAGGGYYVLKRGGERKDLFAQAWKLARDGQIEAAESNLRIVLRSDPEHGRAFSLLARILTADGRMEELKQLCDAWTDRGFHPKQGWRQYVQSLQLRGDFAAAEKEALRRSPVDPVLVHIVRQRRFALAADPRTRFAAVNAARRVADLTESKIQRAASLVRAGELILELRTGMPDEVQQRLEADANSTFGEALVATAEAERANRFDKPACQILYSRILLRTGSPEKMKNARRFIEQRALGDPPDFALCVILIRHLLDREHAIKLAGSDEALDGVSALDVAGGLVPKSDSDARDGARVASASPAQKLTVLRWFGEFERQADAQALLVRYFDGAGGTWQVEAMGIGFLLTGTEDEKQTARERALALVEREKADSTVVSALSRRFFRAGRTEDVIAIIDAARAIKGGSDLDSLLAVLLSRSEADGAVKRASSLADELGRGNLGLGASAATLTTLRGSGPELLRGYLDARIEASTEAQAEHRILRARMDLTLFVRARQDGKQANADEARKRAAADIRAIANDPDAPLHTLEQATEAAYVIGDGELLGACVAGATGREAALTLLAVKLIRSAARSAFDAPTLQDIAKGLRARSAEMPGREFCEALAAVIEAPDKRAQLPELLSSLAKVKQCEVSARLLAMALAGEANQTELVEEHARALVERLPESRDMRVGLGTILLRAEKREAVLALYDGVDDLAAGEYALLATANVQLGHRDRARELCHESIRNYPTDARAFLVLAQLTLSGEPLEGESSEEQNRRQVKQALNLLSAAPTTREVDLRRARLYQAPATARPDRAARIYVQWLMRSVTDYAASDGYCSLLITEKRYADAVQFIELMLQPDAESAKAMVGRFDGFRLSAKNLESLKLLRKNDPHGRMRMLWHSLRGSALEADGRVREALEAYEVTNDPKRLEGNFMTLNNGAWILAEMAHGAIERGEQANEKLAQAKVWVERALRLAPDVPAISDTAAHVYALMGDFDNALAAINRAIDASDDKAAKAKYQFHRARIHEAAGDRVAALRELGALIETYQGLSVEREARTYRESLPAEPPARADGRDSDGPK